MQIVILIFYLTMNARDKLTQKDKGKETNKL